MKTETRRIHAEELFPAIEELLAENRQAVFTVTGNSMRPFLCHNRDQAILEKCDARTLKKGDIILFCPYPGRYILHRITAKAPGGYITTGDGNLHRDGYIHYPNIAAKTVQIIRKGKMIECSHLSWKILSYLWMSLFHVRKQMLLLINAVSKTKKHILKHK